MFVSGQRAHYTARRKEIWEALYPSEPSRDYSLESYGDEGDEQMERIVPPVAKHGHAQPKAFAAETAALTGQSKQEINRQLAVGKALGDDTLRVVGTSPSQDARTPAQRPDRARRCW